MVEVGEVEQTLSLAKRHELLNRKDLAQQIQLAFHFQHGRLKIVPGVRLGLIGGYDTYL